MPRLLLAGSAFLLAVSTALAAGADTRRTLKSGVDALKAGSYGVAEQVFEQVITDRVSSPRAVVRSRALRGSASLRAGKTGLARLDFERALRAAGQRNTRERAWVLSEKCWLHWQSRDGAAAVESANAALAITPGLANAYKCRGHVFKQLGRYPQALADYNRLLRLPELSRKAQVRALSNRGDVHYRRGAYRAAVRDFSRALALQPGHAGLLTARCRALAVGGQPVRAIADCLAALERDGGNPVARDSLGLAYLLGGRPDSALVAFEKILEKDDRAWYAHFHRAIALAELGEDEASADSLERARRLAPSTRAFEKKQRQFRVLAAS